MRKIILAAVTTVALSASGCGGPEKPVGKSAEPEPTAASLSDTDKAAVDALGNDLNKLVEAVDSSTGLKQVYAEKILVNAFNKSEDAAAVNAALDNLRKPGAAKIAGMAAQVRLKK